MVLKDVPLYMGSYLLTALKLLATTCERTRTPPTLKALFRSFLFPSQFPFLSLQFILEVFVYLFYLIFQ